MIGNGAGETEAGPEGPQPGAPTVPNLLSVVRTSETTVTAAWAFPGLANFSRFVIEQKDEEGNWWFVAALGDPSARTCTSATHPMNPAQLVPIP